MNDNAARYDYVSGYLKIGNTEVSMRDFCDLVEYVLTNSDLEKNDPRVSLIARIANLNVVEGFNYCGKRLS